MSVSRARAGQQSNIEDGLAVVVSTDAAEDAARIWQVYRRRFDVEHVRRFGAFTASRVAIRLSIE
ncbi:hypothetical protein [Streptomyces chartreusis]